MSKKFIFSLLCLAIYFVWVYYQEKNSSPKCDSYVEFKNFNIDGTVIDKYLDYSEHAYPIILVENFRGRDTIKVNLALDTTHIFDDISKYDTIIKLKGDSVIFVKNQQRVIKRIMNFGCDKK